MKDFVAGYFRTLVRGKGSAQVRRQGGHGFDEAVPDGFGGMVAREVDEHH